MTHNQKHVVPAKKFQQKNGRQWVQQKENFQCICIVGPATNQATLHWHWQQSTTMTNVNERVRHNCKPTVENPSHFAGHVIWALVISVDGQLLGIGLASGGMQQLQTAWNGLLSQL